MPTSRVQRFIVRAFVPVVCSALTGWLFYQGAVFNTTHPAFQFLWNAVVASVFYHLLAFTRLRNALLGLILLFCLTLWTTNSTQPSWLLRDFLYVTAIGVTILLYIQYFRPGARPFFHAAVTLAGLYGTIYLLAASVQITLLRLIGAESGAVSFASFVTSIVCWGTTIGFAVGTGFALSDTLFGALVLEAPVREDPAS